MIKIGQMIYLSAFTLLMEPQKLLPFSLTAGLLIHISLNVTNDFTVHWRNNSAFCTLSLSQKGKTKRNLHKNRKSSRSLFRAQLHIKIV